MKYYIRLDCGYISSDFAVNLVGVSTRGFETFMYSFLYVDGLGVKSDSLPEFSHLNENVLNNASFIKVVEHKQVIRLLNAYIDMIDFVLIADSDLKKIHKYDDDREMIENCFLVIQLVDSSFWEIFCSEEALIDRIKAFVGSSIPWSCIRFGDKN